jgi:L-alanine-DL-glutamate epimerase-like enolase superfamily enzyme
MESAGQKTTSGGAGGVGISRRRFLRQAGAISCIAGVTATSGGCVTVRPRRTRQRATDVRVTELSYRFDEYVYRAPVKFAGAIMDRASVITVNCTVRTAGGKSAHGIGVMPFNHIFSYPSKRMSQEEKNEAMKALAVRIAGATLAYPIAGHPLEINAELEPVYMEAAQDLSRDRDLPDPIPTLCTRVTANAFDSALHDAYGKLHGQSTFRTYRREFMNYDLSRYLGPSYKGLYPGDYLSRDPRPRMTLCHLIGAVDPINAAENTHPIGDGLPETLAEWTNHNGLLEFKIKVNGDDLQWDVGRVVEIDRVVTETQRKRGVKAWAYVLDFNEKCPNVDYFIEFCQKLKEQAPEGFRRVKYTEQPTSRDLRGHPENDMHEAAKLCPVVIDESVIDAGSILLARDLGWTGAVLKSSKGLSSMILLACLAKQEKIFICGGDMSCPGLALVQTANFQAHVPGITSIEANARQYLPQANEGWDTKVPGLFAVTDGMVRTGELTGAGLGA